MRILIINEFLQMGGTEVQSLREWTFFNEMGHETYLLTFDPKFASVNEGKKLNYPLHMPNILKGIHRLIYSNRLFNQISAIISRIRPDVIHLNQIINLPNEVFKAIRSYPTVQTIRDYGAICPKLTCIDNKEKVCWGYRYKDCKKCMGLSINSIFRRIYLLKYNKIRLLNVNCFISPSKALADYCTSNGIITKCINNPFDFSLCKGEQKNSDGKKVYLYYGIIYENKGINELFEAFEEFQNGKDVELWLAGKIRDDFKERFNSLTRQAAYAKYLGVLSYDQVMDLYRDIYCVVVPSKWLENYPNTVLEAVANKTLVIGSNRGGIPELVGDKRFLFDIDKRQDFIDKLEISYKLTIEEYINITNARYEVAIERNSMKTYYDNMMKVYRNMLTGKSDNEESYL